MEVKHLQAPPAAWQVPLVGIGLPVLLLGQQVLLLEGQRRPLKSLQLTRDLSVVHCQGPARKRTSRQGMDAQYTLQ